VVILVSVQTFAGNFQHRTSEGTFLGSFKTPVKAHAPRIWPPNESSRPVPVYGQHHMVHQFKMQVHFCAEQAKLGLVR